MNKRQRNWRLNTNSSISTHRNENVTSTKLSLVPRKLSKSHLPLQPTKFRQNDISVSVYIERPCTQGTMEMYVPALLPENEKSTTTQDTDLYFVSNTILISRSRWNRHFMLYLDHTKNTYISNKSNLSLKQKGFQTDGLSLSDTKQVVILSTFSDSNYDSGVSRWDCFTNDFSARNSYSISSFFCTRPNSNHFIATKLGQWQTSVTTEWSENGW